MVTSLVMINRVDRIQGSSPNHEKEKILINGTGTHHFLSVLIQGHDFIWLPIKYSGAIIVATTGK